MNPILKSLSDPTRVRVLHLLANRGPEICVCDLVSALGLPQGTVSRHLMHLRYLGIVSDRRQGTWIHYSLADPLTQLHAGLLNCLRTCCDDEKQLTRDLQNFDKLHHQGNLACCSQQPATCSTSPQTTATPKPKAKPKPAATPSTAPRKSNVRQKV